MSIFGQLFGEIGLHFSPTSGHAETRQHLIPLYLSFISETSLTVDYLLQVFVAAHDSHAFQQYDQMLK